MKGALSAVISALALGVLSAAEVSGSNNVVVVQKEVRESSKGWQLLCVPVNGFSIDNATDGTIDVNDFLPAEYYNVGSTLYTVDDKGKSTLACTLTTDTDTSTTAWTPATTLTGGQIFWVKNSEEDTSAENIDSFSLTATETTTTSESADTILFCGQERTPDTITRPDDGAIALLKNDGADTIALADIVSSPVSGDEILVIQDGKKNYMSYYYNGAIWKNLYTRADSSAVTILPGEAFYYQSAK